MFYITENMIGNDFDKIVRCFDLKGSKRHRLVDLTEEEKSGATGLKVLKCQNFIEPGNKLDISYQTKGQILETLDRDSAFLKSHKLIDYSVLLLQIDRADDRIRHGYAGHDVMNSLVYDKKTQQFRMKIVNQVRTPVSSSCASSVHNQIID